nr:hypothetical protein [uncultured Gellertiella sp.]
MPGFSEVQTYLTGLWLLVRGDRAGFAYLDLSERGSLRSFWAIFWCLPPIFLSWAWIRLSYLAAMPTGTHAGSLFVFRLALSELTGWIAPLLLTALVLVIAGFGNRFNALVAVINWLSLPFAYANALLLLVMMLLPGVPGLVAFAWLILLTALLYAMHRLFRMLCGPHQLLIAALVLVQMVPVLFLSDWVDGFLGITPP